MSLYSSASADTQFTNHFKDYFWGDDILSTAGFDTLCSRLKAGRQTCKEFAEFLAQRSRAELEYSRSLQRIARNFSRPHTGESELLTDAMIEVINQTEQIATIHEDAGNVFKTESDVIVAFSEEQKLERKKVEEVYKRSQTNKINAFHKSQSLQKSYYAKCKESDSINMTLEGMKRSVNSQLKEINKLQQRLQKSQEAVDVADNNYKNSIDALSAAHDTWENNMLQLCDVFQQLEAKRIDTLRVRFWSYSNVGSKVCVDEDDSYESMRVSIEKIDIERELNEFVNNSTTGCERPPYVEYVNYYSGGIRKSLPTGDIAEVSPFSRLSSNSDCHDYEYATCDDVQM